ncbi:NADH:ubiquinone oxidoreductase 17.2kDa subunit [Penicillium cf. griseofulvum]|uniref:NADH:ubiquinone oxidoreductase 17.2kDa subunit n=1 Tax=Penicillium cf. griseofulvum TaxID=2972120 RepID=A0A9W9MRI5_9EURO|nr:NADH:ubiquinone oxidoreductase 17.2kDa subunit [Penicillium cf. griseofulvum]KAJ5448814.1 NADH:ubiquinone oxidoreductase 17.2kDa subunit [Penicillium cf. griseofulvum]
MVNSLWFKWKKLRLPWRKSFLVGEDLAGNTFWEFKDVMNAARFRRIVRFDPKTHFSDVQVTPQWHQWLRHVRQDPPSIQEQQQDLVRQAQIKQLARLADERWASKASFLDKPKTQHQAPSTQINEATLNQPANAASAQAPASATSPETPPKAKPEPAYPKTQKEENPWAKANKANPGEEWQPEAWSPSSKR